MKWPGLVAVLLAVCACNEGEDGRVAGTGGGQLTLASSIPIYDEVWDPAARGETLIKVRGIKLGVEEMATVGLGLDDSSRAEFRIFRTRSGELTAAVDIYSAEGVHIDSGERGYGVGSHTNWNHYSDTDNYGVNIRIQHRNSGRHIYHVRPAINGLVAKKTAHADSTTRTPSDSIYTSTELPPPERGLIVLQDNLKNDRCISVRVKGASSSWQQKLPWLFETEDGSVITEDDNTRLAKVFLKCLRTRNLLQ